MGGEEFAIFTSNEEIDSIISIAENIVEDNSKPYKITGGSLKLGISIGTALYSKDATSYRELVYHADMAMYQTKKIKGGSYKFLRTQII